MELEKEIKQTKFQSEQHKAMLNIAFTSSWLENMNSAFLKKYELTPQQFNILRILRGQHPKPASVNLLIERMIDKSSNASRLVEKLKQKQLVERSTCENDRRQVDVAITKKGLKLLTELDIAMKPYAEKFTSISVTEARELNKILDKLRG